MKRVVIDVCKGTAHVEYAGEGVAVVIVDRDDQSRRSCDMERELDEAVARAREADAAEVPFVRIEVRGGRVDAVSADKPLRAMVVVLPDDASPEENPRGHLAAEYTHTVLPMPSPR